MLIHRKWTGESYYVNAINVIMLLISIIAYLFFCGFGGRCFKALST